MKLNFGKAGAKGAPARKTAGKAKKAFSAAGGTRRGWFGAGEDSNLSKWYGPDRALFLPGGLLDRDDLPGYLNGELAGDYGYDPLGLGKDAETLAKYRANELIHARWAMLAAAGILIPEALAAYGADIKGATWFTTPFAMLGGQTLNWSVAPFGVVANPLPLIAVAVINLGLMAAVESYRAKGEGPAGYAPRAGKFDSSVFDGLDPLYPGGPFDPLGLADDPEVFQELQVKEIKNGRLAMIGMLAFFIQGKVTGEGPFANISKHLADPFGYNLLTVLGAGEDRAPTL